MSTTERGIWEPLRVRLAGARWSTAAITWGAVMLASLTIQPLLDGSWWIGRTALVVAVVIAIGGLVRTARLPAPLQPLLQAVALVAALVLLFTDPEPGWGLLPGPSDLVSLRDLAAQGRDYAIVTVPPAPPDVGLLLLVVAGIGLIAVAVDTLAAGLDLPGLTLVPFGALFLVPWAINTGWAPVWAFTAVAVAWFAILAACQRDRATLWSVHARPGSAAVGVAVAAVTTVLALLSGSLATLTGPSTSLGLGTGSGDGTVQIDALVSLRRSLVTQDERVILTYATSARRPDYLRLAVLEEFDGTQWLPAGGGENELGPQPPPQGSASSPGQPLVDYRLDIGPLGGTTLPSPAGTLASANDFPVAWDQRTSLPVRTDGSTIEGTRVALVAQPVTAESTDLRAASTQAPQNGIEPPAETVEAPDDADLAALARDVTRDAATPFDQAVALQRWFTSDGGFRYSTDVASGAGEDALSAFLTERVGYCEQFAATMALMARSLGIPARVVVGFTQGRSEVDQWVVRGTDAHAWPELWMGSAGWVRFEPTPGAPTTITPAYTRDAPVSASPSASPTPGASGPQASPTRVPERDPDADAGAAGAGSGSREVPMVVIVLAIVAALLLVPVVVRIAVRGRRRRRGLAEDAYREVVDTLVDLRLGAEQSTPRATLGVVARCIGGSEEDAAAAHAGLARIRQAVEWQRYGPSSPGAGAAPRGAGAPAGTAVLDRSAEPGLRPGSLNSDVRAVRRALVAGAGTSQRMRAVLAPSSLVTAVAARWAGPDRGERPTG